MATIDINLILDRNIQGLEDKLSRVGTDDECTVCVISSLNEVIGDIHRQAIIAEELLPKYEQDAYFDKLRSLLNEATERRETASQESMGDILGQLEELIQKLGGEVHMVGPFGGPPADA